MDIRSIPGLEERCRNAPSGQAAAELLALVGKTKHEIETNEYKWIDDTDDINYVEFRNRNYLLMLEFEVLLDITKWDYFASKLGLNSSEIEWCRRTHNGVGPSKQLFNLLKTKGLIGNFTLGDILRNLRDLNLKQILTQLKWEKCIKSFRTTEIQGSLSKKINEYVEVVKSCSVASHSVETFSMRIDQPPEVLVNAENKGKSAINEVERKSHSSYAAHVMMIYAADAREEALRAAKQLKTAHGGGKQIGVLLLSDSPSQKIVDSLVEDPFNSIHKWYKQVDYVVPVLSKQYLQQIQILDQDPDTYDERLQNRFLYRLMLDDYVANMSKNRKCRALYNPEHVSLVRNNDLVKGNGLFQMNWNCGSEEQLKQLAEILVSGAWEKRRKTRSS